MNFPFLACHLLLASLIASPMTPAHADKGGIIISLPKYDPKPNPEYERCKAAWDDDLEALKKADSLHAESWQKVDADPDQAYNLVNFTPRRRVDFSCTRLLSKKKEEIDKMDKDYEQLKKSRECLVKYTRVAASRHALDEEIRHAKDDIGMEGYLNNHRSAVREFESLNVGACSKLSEHYRKVRSDEWEAIGEKASAELPALEEKVEDFVCRVRWNRNKDALAKAKSAHDAAWKTMESESIGLFYSRPGAPSLETVYEHCTKPLKISAAQIQAQKRQVQQLNDSTQCLEAYERVVTNKKNVVSHLAAGTDTDSKLVGLQTYLKVHRGVLEDLLRPIAARCADHPEVYQKCSADLKQTDYLIAYYDDMAKKRLEAYIEESLKRTQGTHGGSGSKAPAPRSTGSGSKPKSKDAPAMRRGLPSADKNCDPDTGLPMVSPTLRDDVDNAARRVHRSPKEVVSDVQELMSIPSSPLPDAGIRESTELTAEGCTWIFTHSLCRSPYTEKNSCDRVVTRVPLLGIQHPVLQGAPIDWAANDALVKTHRPKAWSTKTHAFILGDTSGPPFGFEQEVSEKALHADVMVKRRTKGPLIATFEHKTIRDLAFASMIEAAAACGWKPAEIKTVSVQASSNSIAQGKISEALKTTRVLDADGSRAETEFDGDCAGIFSNTRCTSGGNCKSSDYTQVLFNKLPSSSLPVQSKDEKGKYLLVVQGVVPMSKNKPSSLTITFPDSSSREQAKSGMRDLARICR